MINEQKNKTVTNNKAENTSSSKYFNTFAQEVFKSRGYYQNFLFNISRLRLNQSEKSNFSDIKNAFFRDMSNSNFYKTFKRKIKKEVPCLNFPVLLTIVSNFQINLKELFFNTTIDTPVYPRETPLNLDIALIKKSLYKHRSIYIYSENIAAFKKKYSNAEDVELASHTVYNWFPVVSSSKTKEPNLPYFETVFLYHQFLKKEKKF